MARSRRGRGEGSIYQRADGLWVASISAGHKANGKRRRLVAYGETKQVAREKLKGIVADRQREPGKLTIADLGKSWLEVKKTSVAAGTYRRYEQLVRSHITPRIGHLVAHGVEPLDIQDFYGQMLAEEETTSNTRKAGECLLFMFDYAVQLHLVKHNPVKDAKRPRHEKAQMHVWSQAQAQAFLEAAKTDPFHTLYAVALSTGLREGELFALGWADIEFADRSLQVTKTLEEEDSVLRIKPPKTAKGRRRVDLPDFVVELLAAHKERKIAENRADAPVFSDSRGGYLRRSNVRKRSFHPLIAKAGVPTIRFHDLRHTAATLLLLAGVHPKIVSERLGHASVEITLNTYSHVLPTMQRDAANHIERLLS
jgi:integrase